MLERSLNFIPSSTSTPDLRLGVERLSRTLRLDNFFNNQPDDPPPPPNPFRQKSAWQPPPASREIGNYISDLPGKLDAMPRFRSNLSREQLRAVNLLAKDTSLVIRKADKGSCVVVEDRDSYIVDGLANLGVGSIYVPVPLDSTVELARGINQYVAQLVHLRRYGSTLFT